MLSIQIDTKSLEVGCSPTVQQIQIVLLCTIIRYSRANVVNHQKRTFPNEKHKHAQYSFFQIVVVKLLFNKHGVADLSAWT